MQNNISNNNSSLAVSPQQGGYNSIMQEIATQVQNVKGLVQQNLITQEQGQYLLTQLAGKLNQINNTYTPQQQEPAPAQPEQTQFEMFNTEHPEFFKSEGRGDILNYLKPLNLDKDELVKIAQLVEGLEKSAVDRYLKKSEYEKSLNDENTLAKSKLTAYAQNSAPETGFNRVYTREEIGNMSGEEFTKNEKAIMEQVKLGLIK